MLIQLHKQATTTLKVRAAIQASDGAGTVLAERFGVTPQTICKWRKRDGVEDRSHTPHRLQTTLTAALRRELALRILLQNLLLILSLALFSSFPALVALLLLASAGFLLSDPTE